MKVLAFVGRPKEDSLKRFFREARIAAQLDHEAIVKVIDMGKVESAAPPGFPADGVQCRYIGIC